MNGRIRGRGPGLTALCALALVTVSAGAAPSSGTAETSNTILSLTVGDETVAVGVDSAEARRAATRLARASFTAGQSALATIGALEASGTSDADSGSDEATEGDLSIDGLASLTLVEAAASVDLSPSHVASSAGATLADISLMGGLLSLDGLTTATETEVTGLASGATRSISLEGLQVFELAGFLEALGVDEASVPCEGVEGAGAALGLDASQACEQVAAVEAALAAARDDLDALAGDLDAIVGGFVRDDVQADRDAAAALACAPLDAVCIAAALATLTALATEYGVTLSDPTDLTTTQDEVVAALDELLAAIDDRSAIADAIDAAAAGTCDATITALTDAEAELSAEDPAGAAPILAAARAEVDAACADARTTLDAVMAAPIVTMDDVVITLTAHASEGETDAGVSVTIGAVRVGYNDAIAVADIGEGLAAADEIAQAVTDVVDALVLDAPTPSVELFAVSTDEGETESGSWFADASLAILQITQPAGPVTVPDDPPFGPLAVVDAPQVVVRAVVFDAASSFTPATSGDDDDPGNDDPGNDDPGNDGNGGGDGGPDLPVTGTRDDPLTLAAMLLIVVAAVTRRWLGAAG